MLVEVTTYYLEITERAALRPARAPELPVEIRQARIPLPELNRMMYVAVGRDWHWRERLVWSRERWLEYMGRAELETHVAYVEGTPAGYFEQELQPGDNVEIVNFGMLPQFVGRGLGGHMLVRAVERGWERGAKRVWLHTCTLDHPTALAHYQARGFRLFDKKVFTKEVEAKANDECGMMNDE
ncbi:MAG: GNAT family N-acetyltransferase [Planctomycetia bacterium]|nr:GNAT family N-acetyltransferase [Planctomycetia bacterium]